MTTVNLSRVGTVLDTLTYPVDRTTARDELEGTTVDLADGQVDLGDLLERSDVERFDSATDLEMALHNVLPREAVGEPYQSEGEG